MPTSARHRIRSGVAVLVGLTLLVAGCTLDSDDGDDEEVPAVRVRDAPGIGSILLRFAVDRGFFAEQGLDMRLEPNPGGADTIPGVLAGEVEIAGTDVSAALLARSQGASLRMISAGTFAADEPQSDFAQVLVRPDGPIADPADLDGHRVAVNALPNIAEVTIRGALEGAGADHTALDFVEIGYPDMIRALRDGRVEAIHLTEPFLSLGLREGLRPIVSPYAQTQPGMTVGSYVSSDEFIEQHPEVVERFAAGVSAASDYLAANPDEFRAILIDLPGIDPATAASVSVPRWGGAVNASSVALIGDLMLSFGQLDQLPAPADVVHQP